MIDILITLGAVAESQTMFGPNYSYQLPAAAIAQRAPAKPPAGQPWQPPMLHFDDAQDCLTFLERQIEGFGLLRITHCHPEGVGEPIPWRSL